MIDQEFPRYMNRVLVTGGSGFIGRRLVNALIEEKVAVSVLTRDPARARGPWRGDVVHLRRGDLTEPSSLRGLCDGYDTVFHLAGYAHAEVEDADTDRMRHENVSVSGTRWLLRSAQEANVRSFVYASSVKAVGEGKPEQLDETAKTIPTTAYGQAKFAAEELVLTTGRRTGMHVAVLRLPLVYGPGSKGNVLKMIAAIDCGRFPPLPETGNRRSMVHVDDVVQALLLAAQKPEAAGQTYIVTDGVIYSTRTIYTAICQALDRPLPRSTVPVALLRFGARIGDVIGRLRGRPLVFNSEALEKLIGSAWYRNEKIRRELGFVPRRTLEEALPEMIGQYRKNSADVS